MGWISKRGIKMLWRKPKVEEIKVNESWLKIAKIIQEEIEAKAKADAEELDRVQRNTCATKCKYWEQERSSYPETNSHCDTCDLNRTVAKRMEDAGLLGVVRSEAESKFLPASYMEDNDEH